MKKLIVLWLTLLMAALLVAGCQGRDTSSSSLEEGDDFVLSYPDSPASSSSAQPQEEEEKEGELDIGTYVEMMRQGTFYLTYASTITAEGQSLPVTGAMAQKDGVRAMYTEVDTSLVKLKTRLLLKDGKAYMIDDSTGTYTETVIDGVAALGVDYTDITLADSGEDTIDDRVMAYEEYLSGGDRVRFYADSHGLYAIQVNAEGVTMTMRVLEMSDKIPAKILELPE